MTAFTGYKKFFAPLLGFLFLFLSAESVQAAYKIEIGLPGLAAGSTVSDPAAYIKYLFVFGLSLAGFLAVGAIVWGGIQYIAAGTSLTSASKGREWIYGALSGIVLLLCSYLILYTIDPSLTRLTPTIPKAGDITAPPPESNATRNCNPPCKTGFFCRASDYTCQALPAAASAENITCLTPGRCQEGDCTATGNCNSNRPARLPRLVWNPNTCSCAQP